MIDFLKFGAWLRGEPDIGTAPRAGGKEARRSLPKKRVASPETGTLALDGQQLRYVIERSARRRRTFSISLTPSGDVRVVVPSRASRRSVEDILHHRRDWIARKRADLQKRPTLPARCADGAVIPYLGDAYPLRLTFNSAQKQGCVLADGVLTINLPDSPFGEERQHAAQLELTLWYKKQAKAVLRRRMDYWSQRLDLPYRRLIISSPATRWGSCNRDNDIRLNWRVILSSMPLIDYLVVHELCHVRQKNHSAKFWALVGAAIPDYKLRRKQLRGVG